MNREFRGNREFRVFRARKVRRVFRARKARRASREFKGRKAHKGQEDTPPTSTVRRRMTLATSL